MPSVTDVQQQSSNNNGRSPSLTSSQQQQILTDTANADPITQAILVLEKKQRNLGKRKEKLESYEQEAKSGKELHKDQIEALAKYPEVLGQIECAKDISEQLKKIQSESSKNQKRLSKQIAEEKRLQISQRLREYAQLRYLLDHRPTTLKPEESSLLDELSRVIIPSDNSSDTITRSIDTVLSIYQGGSSSGIIKNLTGKTPQEIRDTLEELMAHFHIETSSEFVHEQEQTKEIEEINHMESTNKNFNEYPLQFDTRNQNIPLEQIIENNPFFPIDLTKTQLAQDENTNEQSPDPKQYLQTLTIVNSNINDQPSSSIQNQQEENSTNVTNDEQQQQSEEHWQQRRGTGNAAHRGAQYNNEGGNRNYGHGWPNNYNQRPWRGPRGGRYDNNSYSGGQRQYYENTRGRGGSNSNYRGNRGGNYRGGNRGYNGNGYQNSPQYQQNNDQQYQQVRSAPPSQQQ